MIAASDVTPMLFALKKILSALLMPPVFSILLAFVGLWLARSHRPTGPARAGASLLRGGLGGRGVLPASFCGFCALGWFCCLGCFGCCSLRC